jgi:hypothetical protein
LASVDLGQATPVPRSRIPTPARDQSAASQLGQRPLAKIPVPVLAVGGVAAAGFLTLVVLGVLWFFRSSDSQGATEAGRPAPPKASAAQTEAAGSAAVSQSAESDAKIESKILRDEFVRMAVEERLARRSEAKRAEVEAVIAERLPKELERAWRFHPEFLYVTPATETALAAGRGTSEADERVALIETRSKELGFRLDPDLVSALESRRAGKLSPVQVELLAHLMAVRWRESVRGLAEGNPDLDALQRVAEVERKVFGKGALAFEHTTVDPSVLTPLVPTTPLEALREKLATLYQHAAARASPSAAPPHAEVPSGSAAPQVKPPVSPSSGGTTSGPADRQPISKEAQRLGAAIQEVRAEKLGVFVRCESMGHGPITALLNAGQTSEERTNWTRAVPLADGQGIPLSEVEYQWSANVPPPNQCKLIVEVREQPPFRIYKLRLPELDRKTGSEHVRKHVWSADGNDLYLLTQAGCLLHIAATDWQLRRTVCPTPSIAGVALSSAGLIALQQASTEDSTSATPWVMLEPAPDQPQMSAPGRLLVVDPQTLAVRRAYALAGSGVAGHPEQAIVYVRQDAAVRLLVIQATAGRLLNTLPTAAVCPERTCRMKGSTSRISGQAPVIDFSTLAYSPDGQWLLAIPNEWSPSGTVSRFRPNGPHIICEQALTDVQRESEAIAHFSSDGCYLCVPDNQGGPGFSLLQTADFEAVAGRLEAPRARHYALNDVSKTLFVEEQLPLGMGKVHVQQAGKHWELPLPEMRIQAIHTRPGSGGALVLTTDWTAYWIEFSEPAVRWGFETESMSDSMDQAPGTE